MALRGRTTVLLPVSASKVVITDQQQRFDESRREDPKEIARVFGRAKGQITLKFQLDDWIRDAIVNRFGAELNFTVQRTLKGQAKSLWMQLASIGELALTYGRTRSVRSNWRSAGTASAPARSPAAN